MSILLGYNGRMVTFGQASGQSNSISLDLLMDRSIGVSGYWVTPFQRDEASGREAMATILAWIADGKLRVVEGPVFPVARAGEAQAAIEARATVGKVTLTVDGSSWQA